MRIRYALLAAFLITYFCTPICRRIAVRFRVVDLPSRRKMHKTATPLMGGLAIYIGAIASLLIFRTDTIALMPILLGGTLIMLLGLGDDIWSLSAKFRMVCQVIIALMVIDMGLRIDFVPHGIWKQPLETFITLLWIVGLTNAYNYLDGLDGLAAGSAIINLLCFSFIFRATNQALVLLIAAVIIGACAGFLPYNFRKPKIFLGDAGSTFLGFTLACVGLIGNWASDNFVKIAIPIIVLGVPIFDMVFTTVMRISEGKVKTILEWLHYGGKDHFHHYLIDIGMSPLGSVIFIYAVTLSLGISAIKLSGNDPMGALLTLAQVSIMFGFIAVLIVLGKRKHHHVSGHDK